MPRRSTFSTPPGASSWSETQDRRIHRTLYLRTLWISVVVTVTTLLLGYPIAWLLANLPLRHRRTCC